MVFPRTIGLLYCEMTSSAGRSAFQILWKWENWMKFYMVIPLMPFRPLRKDFTELQIWGRKKSLCVCVCGIANLRGTKIVARCVFDLEDIWNRALTPIWRSLSTFESFTSTDMCFVTTTITAKHNELESRNLVCNPNTKILAMYKSFDKTPQPEICLWEKVVFCGGYSLFWSRWYINMVMEIFTFNCIFCLYKPISRTGTYC